MNIHNNTSYFKLGLATICVAVVLSLTSAFTVNLGADYTQPGTETESQTETESTEVSEVDLAVESQPATEEVETGANGEIEIQETTEQTGIETEVQTEETTEETIDDEYYINLTDDEIYTLATLVYLEAGIESFECQKAVASVVINRMTTQGLSLDEVVYAKNQFTPSGQIKYNCPTDSTLGAVMDVVMNGPNIPEYVTYFREGYFFDWAIDYVKYDHTCFSYTQEVYDLLMGK